MNSNQNIPADVRIALFAAAEDPQDLADVLIQELGMHATDAMIQAHSAPGLLPHRFPREQSEKLIDALQKLGLQAAAFADDELPDLHHSRSAHHCRCTTDGLEVIGADGKTENSIPWNDLDFICVGIIPQSTSRHYPTRDMSVLSAARRSPHAPLETPATEEPELWFARRNPFRPYRLDQQRMNYEYLGEKKTSSAAVNFQLFLKDLVQQAPQAYLAPSTRAFLNHGPESHYHFKSAEELASYAQFHLLIHQSAPHQNKAQS